MALPTSAFRGHAALVYICIALLSITSVSAQLLNFGAGALPTCAQQCQYLTQAQDACLPATNQLSCFCQSAYLTTLRTDATSTCGNVCQGADLTQISSWYASTCAAANIAAPAAAATTTTAAAAPTTTTAGAATTTTAPNGSTTTSSTSQNGSSIKKSSAPQSWWSSHWRWILMLILIAVLLGGIAFFAVLLRRRWRRKRDQMSGRFNDGITTRSMTQVNNNVAPATVGHPYSTHPRGRPTSSMLDGARGVSASTTTLSRTREAGNAPAADGITPPASEESSTSRGELSTQPPPGEPRNGKGKLRARISEEDV